MTSHNVEFSMLTLGVLSLASANDIVSDFPCCSHRPWRRTQENSSKWDLIWVVHRLCHHIHGNLFGSFGLCLLVQDRIRRRPCARGETCVLGFSVDQQVWDRESGPVPTLKLRDESTASSGWLPTTNLGTQRYQKPSGAFDRRKVSPHRAVGQIPQQHARLENCITRCVRSTVVTHQFHKQWLRKGRRRAEQRRRTPDFIHKVQDVFYNVRI